VTELFQLINNVPNCVIGRSEIDLTFYAIYDISTDPDVVATLSQVNATRSLHRGALCGDVRRWRKSGTNEPLRQTSIQTPGDRIFVSPVTDECPHFEVGLVARWVGPNHADFQWMKDRPIGLERQNLARGGQHYRAPARPVVHPLVMPDI